uniref:Transmembrane protein 200B n=1 Tax=Buteo japonicus TaxID=224669 RepID=A0A8C0BK80_9AVES
MTAESAETNGPMREPEGGTTKPPSPPEVPVKGQLRMCSPSGAFVMVGISVVLVGMTIAVVGYWPHRGPGGTGAGARNASIAGDMRREVAAGRHVPHSEKLKLIGPVIMGIGLFIFICANTMLYENRDMETRRLMQKGLYSMAAGLPEGTELSPDAQLHAPGHSKSLDLGQPGMLLVAPIKDRKNRSWPRLDHVSLVGYAKLESTGESSDRLLEPSEPPSRGELRPSSWVVGMERGVRV